jgi:hypothetical protein
MGVMSAMMGDVGLTGTLIEGSRDLKHRNFPKNGGPATAPILSTTASWNLIECVLERMAGEEIS